MRHPPSPRLRRAGGWSTAAAPRMTAHDGPETFENRLVLLERGGHLIGGDPGIGVETLRAEFQLVPYRLVHRLLGDSSQNLRISRPETDQPFGPQSHERC